MKLEVYENNADALYLCILDEKDMPLIIFENWEYGYRGELKEAMKILIDDPSAFVGWDGDLYYDLHNDLNHPYEGTVCDLYNEISENNLIAEFDGGNIITYPENMGAAGHWSLDEPEL